MMISRGIPKHLGRNPPLCHRAISQHINRIQSIYFASGMYGSTEICRRRHDTIVIRSAFVSSYLNSYFIVNKSCCYTSAICVNVSVLTFTTQEYFFFFTLGFITCNLVFYGIANLYPLY
jgi:hypothetical protein